MYKHSGIYLLLKYPEQNDEKTPNGVYCDLVKSRSWLRVDIAICITMGVVFFGIGTILLFGFIKVSLI